MMLSVEKPLPLIGMISKLPGIRVSVKSIGTDAGLKKIVLVLQES
jgi:hypothetical protein